MFGLNNGVAVWQINAWVLGAQDGVCPPLLGWGVMPFFSYFFIFLCALVAMAFYTLFERKLLGHAQVRKGPNKVGYMGVLQPFSDAMKLFLKQLVLPVYGNYFGFCMGPIFALFLSLIIWSFYSYCGGSFFFLFGCMLFLVVSRMRVYSVLISGWCSNSKYALLGVMRSVAQTISYEIRMALFLLGLLLLLRGLRFFSFLYARGVWAVVVVPPLLFVWCVTLLAETNRSPFDFAEGESEIVSGFNIEYSAGPFAFIFMAEYARILSFRVLTMLLFARFGLVWGVSGFLNSFFSMVVWFFVVLVRACLPRMRYDCLMMLT